MRMFLRNDKFRGSEEPLASCVGSIVLTRGNLKKILDSYRDEYRSDSITIKYGYF